MSVRVVVVAVSLLAARHVDVGEPLEREPVQERDRIPAEVPRVRVEVREVEEEERARPVEDLAEERRLVHLRAGPLEEGRYVLERERHRELGLHGPHVLDDDLERLARARHGEEVARLETPPSHEAEVLAHERRAEPRLEVDEPIDVRPRR